jgi:hypothetical protein
LGSNLDKDGVLNIIETDCNDCHGLPEYHADMADGLTPSTKSASISLQSGEITASEFRRGIRRDKTNYAELKDEHFNTCKRGSVATAFMLHTQFVLDGDYVPVTPTEVGFSR